MQKKLTLSIDAELIAFVHSFAKRSKQSVSGIVQMHLDALRNVSEQRNLSSETPALYGIFEAQPLPIFPTRPRDPFSDGGRARLFDFFRIPFVTPSFQPFPNLFSKQKLLSIFFLSFFHQHAQPAISTLLQQYGIIRE